MFEASVSSPSTAVTAAAAASVGVRSNFCFFYWEPSIAVQDCGQTVHVECRIGGEGRLPRFGVFGSNPASAVADGVGKLAAWFVLDPVVPDCDSNTILHVLKVMLNNNKRPVGCGPYFGADRDVADEL
jgi:hypothetical protein